ncbi:hypothetical protein [Sporosarcina sp. GW1-11]|nr:hypothetical protein [Sporosarcina sp. GW1-11]
MTKILGRRYCYLRYRSDVSWNTDSYNSYGAYYLEREPIDITADDRLG